VNKLIKKQKQKRRFRTERKNPLVAVGQGDGERLWICAAQFGNIEKMHRIFDFASSLFVCCNQWFEEMAPISAARDLSHFAI
jgi:hypothetical protein